jgi:hypothetical protein
MPSNHESPHFNHPGDTTLSTVSATSARLPAGFVAGLFRRERLDDFLEARVAAQRVPEGQQL